MQPRISPWNTIWASSWPPWNSHRTRHPNFSKFWQVSNSMKANEFISHFDFQSILVRNKPNQVFETHGSCMRSRWLDLPFLSKRLNTTLEYKRMFWGHLTISLWLHKGLTRHYPLRRSPTPFIIGECHPVRQLNKVKIKTKRRETLLLRKESWCKEIPWSLLSEYAHKARFGTRSICKHTLA